MKVITEKDYIYLRREGEYHVFQSNPAKENFDTEILMVLRARYITKEGKSKFFDYIK